MVDTLDLGSNEATHTGSIPARRTIEITASWSWKGKGGFFFSLRKQNMGPSFKAYRTGMVTVLEKCPCGRKPGQRGRNNVFYLCLCDCGKEFIVGGDELSKHPYSCGCKKKPDPTGRRSNRWALGYYKKKRTMSCMTKPTRAVYSTSTSDVSGVCWDKRRKKWYVTITYCQKEHFLDYFERVLIAL